MTKRELADFSGPMDFDLRLRDHLADEDLSDQRKQLAALSIGEDPPQAEILADEVHFAFLLMDLDTTEGAEWVEHIRLTSRFHYQLALLHLVLPMAPVYRVKDLEWLLLELKRRRWLLPFCERHGVPYVMPRMPQADVPAWWDRNGPYPLTEPFVPTGYTQREWLESRDDLAVRALDVRNDELNARHLPF